MRAFTTPDSNSPWYETFSPKHLPAVWVTPQAAKPQAPPPAPDEPADADWATEAIFDCYNA